MRYLLHFGLFVVALTAVTQADAQDRRHGDRHTTVVIAAGGGPREWCGRFARAWHGRGRSTMLGGWSTSRRDPCTTPVAPTSISGRTSSKSFRSRRAGNRRPPIAARMRSGRSTVGSMRGWSVRSANRFASLATTATPSECASSATSLPCSNDAATTGRGHYEGGHQERGHHGHARRGHGQRGYYGDKARILDELVALSEQQVHRARAGVRYPFQMLYAYR